MLKNGTEIVVSSHEKDRVAARAVELFNNGYNCAESTATAVGDWVDLDQVVFPRLATCFGGGCAREGETCGALVGALLVISYVYGRKPGEGNEAKERAYAAAGPMVTAFRNKFGAVTCRGLIGLVLSDPVDFKTYRDRDLHHTQCINYVTAAARLAAEALAP